MDKPPDANRHNHFKYINEKYPSTSSATKLCDVKQARAALAEVLQQSTLEHEIEEPEIFDELLAEFLASIGANLFASAGVRTVPGKLRPLQTIADQTTAVSVNKRVHRIQSKRPLPPIHTVSVASHIIPAAKKMPTKESSRGVPPSIKAWKQEKVRKIRDEARRCKREVALAKVEFIGSLSARVIKEQKLCLETLTARKMWDEREMVAMRSKVKIVVVGAGLAGLSAADHLLKSGFSDVTVLEALDRVGGRICSVPYSEPPWEFLELGLPSVEKCQDNSVYALIKESGLKEKYARTKRSLSTIMGENGIPVKAEINFYLFMISKLFQRECNLIHTHIGSSSGQDVNLAYKDYMRERYRRFVQNESRFANICKTAEYLNVVSKFHPEADKGDLAIHLLELYGKDDCKKVELFMGMETLMKPLTSLLPADRLLLNTAVKQIEWSKSWPGGFKVRLKCNRGRVFYADLVIVAVPLGHLKETYQEMFAPPLPVEKQTAIRNVGYGTLSKVYLCYKPPFWSKPIDFVWSDAQNAANKLYRNIVTFNTLDRRPSVLEVNIVGESTENMTDIQLAQELTAILGIFSQRKIPLPVEIIRTAWYTNPYFRGSHPYLSTQSSEKDLSILREPLMRGDVPVVLFAGDYTHTDYKNLAHSARASGLREAGRLVNMYNKYHGFENDNSRK